MPADLALKKLMIPFLPVSFFEVNVPQVRLLLIWRVSLSELWERRSEDVAEIAEMHGGTKLSNPRPPLL